MKRSLQILLMLLLSVSIPLSARAEEPAQGEYLVGVDDLLEINVLQPEKLTSRAAVSPDGAIMVPYIGRVIVKGLTLTEIKEEVEARLADGYMKYPVVSASLMQSRSRKFFVYGEVVKPGAYPIEESMTCLKAVSVAGGFSKFGSSSRVKILRLKEGSAGYNTIKVNIQKVMDGSDDKDIILQPGDIVVVSEGMF